MNLFSFKMPLIISGIVIVVLFVTSNINWGGDRSKNIIRSDGKCYNLYLPAIFIYNDLSFKFVQETEFKIYYDKNNCLDCRQYLGDKVFDKYTAGVALAQLPFFISAHIYAKLTGFSADGYSAPYQICITIAALFYLFMGLWFLNLMLATYKIKPINRILVLICCVFGTNLFYYTVGEPGLSHVYSFAFVNMLVYNARQYFAKGASDYLVKAGIAIGMIFLIRPVNLIILPGILVFADNRQNFISKIKLLRQKLFPLLFALLCFSLIASVQVAIYLIQTGHLWFYSYGNESFDFSRPEIINILFSYKKGLFLYTPLYLISLLGLFFMYRKQKLATISLPIFLLFFTYIVSSWWNWWYGGSFSSRVYVDILVFFMMPLAFLMEAIKKRLYQISLIVFLFLVVALCQLQTYQYRYYQIHWENMTKEKYWDNFLRMDKL
jgi:hypothetical protein